MRHGFCLQSANRTYPSGNIIKLRLCKSGVKDSRFFGISQDTRCGRVVHIPHLWVFSLSDTTPLYCVRMSAPALTTNLLTPHSPKS